MGPGAVAGMQALSRREAILAAALQLFSERGYRDTGIDEIGKAAGITGPGVYRHFRNKEEILAVLMQAFAAPTLAAIDRIVASDLEPLAALDAITRTVIGAMIDNPSLTRVAMLERREVHGPVRTWVDEADARTAQGWVGVLRRVRPDLDEPEAMVVVQAAVTAGLAVCDYDHALDREALMGLLHPLVMIVFGAPARPC